ncbi:MAG: hypothetical protein F6K65_42310 [Moorea sp. SIO3C2]|nr:hypothetical protein [Moorena sp. SIO3C2]
MGWSYLLQERERFRNITIQRYSTPKSALKATILEMLSVTTDTLPLLYLGKN